MFGVGDSSGSRGEQTELITDADLGLTEDHTYRVWRYSLTMGLRLGCLLLAVLLRGTPFVWLAIVGAVALPWIAVLMANDRLPRGRRRAAWHPGARGPGPGDAGPALGHHRAGDGEAAPEPHIVWTPRATEGTMDSDEQPD